MARPVTITKSLTASSVNAIVTSATLTAAGDFTLTATPVVLTTQRQVLFTFAADETGHPFFD